MFSLNIVEDAISQTVNASNVRTASTIVDQVLNDVAELTMNSDISDEEDDTDTDNTASFESTVYNRMLTSVRETVDDVVRESHTGKITVRQSLVTKHLGLTVYIQ